MQKYFKLSRLDPVPRGEILMQKEFHTCVSLEQAEDEWAGPGYRGDTDGLAPEPASEFAGTK